ncbi:SLAM family member 8, partial [Neopelma chrysocephalum]|uniref:SLAM family member 8 n=1 Tax=Neopelma chrysocephalum TaxID=114329 RepID=UPI000FCD1073
MTPPRLQQRGLRFLSPPLFSPRLASVSAKPSGCGESESGAGAERAARGQDGVAVWEPSVAAPGGGCGGLLADFGVSEPEWSDSVPPRGWGVGEGTAATRTRQVNGVLGGSALLSLDLLPNETVKAVDWAFLDVNSVKNLVAEFHHGEFERSNPQDRFGDRLEVNETALRIGTLERGDSGIYEARIILHPTKVETQLFALSVYDPVPEPQIQGRQLSLTPQECNLTLRCQAAPGSDATVTWQLGSSQGVPQARLCGDNQTLCLALPVAAFSSTYTCLARNPAQERNVSVHLDTLCQQQGKNPSCAQIHPPGGSWHPPRLVPADTGASQGRHVFLVLVAVGILALLGIAWIWRRRRRRRRRRRKKLRQERFRCPRPPLQRGSPTGALVLRDPEEKLPGASGVSGRAQDHLLRGAGEGVTWRVPGPRSRMGPLTPPIGADRHPRPL